jgi:hypothetical protein
MGLLFFWREPPSGNATATIDTLELTLSAQPVSATGDAATTVDALDLTLTPLDVTVGAPVLPPRPPGGYRWRVSTVLPPVHAVAMVERLTLQLIPQALTAHGEVDDLRRLRDEAEALLIMGWDLQDLLELDERLVDAL